MSDFYSNITVLGPSVAELVTHLRGHGVISYVTPAPLGFTVVFHEDLAGQEALAANVSATFSCPALLSMVFGRSVLLYHLYNAGERIDAYVSSPHEGLELDGPAPAGNAETLCAAFGRENRVASVERVLRKPGTATNDYAYAINRHGELLRALKMPLFAAGSGFAAIDAGELPAGSGFDPGSLIRTQ